MTRPNPNLRGYAGCRPRNIASLGMGLDLSLGNGRGSGSGAAPIVGLPSYVAQINGPSDGPRAPYYNSSSLEANADNPTVTADTPFTVDYLGSDTAGVDTTWRRTLYLRGRQRNTSTSGDPTGATLTLRTLVPSGYIHAGDVAYASDNVTPITHNGTLTVPKVMARWHTVPCQVLGAGLRISVLAFHKFPQYQMPVACVKITGTPTTGSAVTKTCTYGASGQYSDTTADDWGATFADSDFPSNGNAAVTFTATAIPWIGRTSGTRSTSGSFPDITQWTPMPMFTGTVATFHAVVDTAGNDGTGVANATYATAYALPFATELAATNALIVAASGELSNCFITFKAGTHTISATTPTGATVQALKSWFTYRGDPADPDPYNNVNFTTGANNRTYWKNGAGTHSLMRFQNLKVTGAAGFNLGNFAGRNLVWFDHANVVNNVGGSTSIIGNCQMAWATNCDITASGSMGFGLSGSNQRFELIYNCRSLKPFAANCVSCTTQSGSTAVITLGEATNLSASNVIAYNTAQTGLSGAVIAIILPLVGATTGTITDVAIVQPLINGAGSGVNAWVINDKQRQTITNVLVIHPTLSRSTEAGNQDATRANEIFDGPTSPPDTIVSDPIPTAIGVTVIAANCSRLPFKGDIFSRQNNLDAGANFLHGAIAFDNSLDCHDTVSEWTTDDNFKHTFMGINSAQKTNITYTNRDGGDLHPVSGHKVVPFGRQALARDITGAARSQAGTASGAYVSSLGA